MGDMIGKKLLIIDDNQDDLDIIKKQLNQAGYDEVLIAATGEKGIESASKNKPDIVVIDTLMPGIDGFEVCQRIKTDNGSEAKVIMITGIVDAFDANKANQAGADAYITKPFKSADLLAQIEELLQSSLCN